MSATSAMAATVHGSADAKLRGSSAAVADADVPHRWQNRAPGVSGAPHCTQSAPASEAPQFEQNLPDASAWQLGQVFGTKGAG